MHLCESRRRDFGGRQHRRVLAAVKAAVSPGSESRACRQEGFPGTREPRHLHFKEYAVTRESADPNPRLRARHLVPSGAHLQVIGWYRQTKETKCGGKGGEESECSIVCAGQRLSQEG